MVSSSVGMALEEVVEALRRMSQEYADDADFKAMRAALPDDFPF